MSISENNYFKNMSFIELGWQQEQDVLPRYSNPSFLDSFSSALFNISAFDFTSFLSSFEKNIFSTNNLNNGYANFGFGSDCTWNFSQNPRYSDLLCGTNFDSFSTQIKSEYKPVTTPVTTPTKTSTVTEPIFLPKRTFSNIDNFVFTKRITSNYGQRKHPVTGEYKFHSGVDYSFYEGESIYSPIDGVVEKISQDSISGKYVVIRSSDGARHIFCHCSDTSLINVGEKVEKNAVIALAGHTGRVTGPHLHYGIKMNGESVNPQEYYA